MTGVLSSKCLKTALKSQIDHIDNSVVFILNQTAWLLRVSTMLMSYQLGLVYFQLDGMDAPCTDDADVAPYCKNWKKNGDCKSDRDYMFQVCKT